MGKQGWLSAVLAMAVGAPLGGVRAAAAGEPAASAGGPCSVDVRTLVANMLPDLPGYANRVNQRSRRPGRPEYARSNVMVAGNPEFEPLPLAAGNYPPALPQSQRPNNVEQVFFTTLRRQYGRKRAFEVQHYHRMFLVRAEAGWRLALLYSRWGSPPPNRLPLPPRETSNGTVGQAIQLWLRDCRAGALELDDPRETAQER